MLDSTEQRCPYCLADLSHIHFLPANCPECGGVLVEQLELDEEGNEVG